MEVQMSPASLFNGGNAKLMRASSPQSYGPTSKRFKSDLTFQCMICNDVYDDMNVLYEHMKSQHHELYDCNGGPAEGSADAHGFASDSKHELSDEEYHDLSHLLEPICELRQDDDDDDNESQNASTSSNVIAQLIQNTPFATEQQLRLQLQLQMQLQNHLLQMQMNGATVQPNKSDQTQADSKSTKPLSLRKLKIQNW